MAPKGFNTFKSKEERYEEEVLLEPTKSQGKKIKKNKAKKLAAAHQGAQKGIAHQREFKLNTLFGALEIDPPEDPSEYPAKLEQLKKLKTELEEKYKLEVEAHVSQALQELEDQRKAEQEARDRGERPPHRGGRGRGGRGGGDHYRGGSRGGGRGGSGRGGRGGRGGGGYKGHRKYSDEDEDTYEEPRPQKKKREPQHYGGVGEGAWPELGME